jgi:demethylmenaquinone methyltransferase/2-methoxy-6-polyprenyl-1,4-benzoquinol methylase
MNTKEFAKTKIGQRVIGIMASIMESRFRYRFFGPMKIIEGAAICPGENVLEVGCGTGYFSIPLARFIGEKGSLTAIDILQKSIETVSEKVQIAHLQNVQVFKGDALNMQLASESMDAILLFGVIPAPMLPMNKLLPEMHRILKPGGKMSVWPPIGVHKSIHKSQLFSFSGKRNNVLTYRRI